MFTSPKTNETIKIFDSPENKLHRKMTNIVQNMNDCTIIIENSTICVFMMPTNSDLKFPMTNIKTEKNKFSNKYRTF